jgi:opacity protein-like surface antigen
MENKHTRFILVIAILIFVSMTCACSSSAQTPSIVGTWEGTYLGTTIRFIFQDKAGFIFSMNGQESGRGQYKVDTSTNPIGLDLLYNESMAYTIIKFTDSNTMLMENANPGDVRPTKFSDTFTLLRITP